MNNIKVAVLGRRGGKTAAAYVALMAWANKEVERALIGETLRTGPTPAPSPPALPARPRTALGWGLLGALVALSLVACTPNVQPPQVPPGYKESPYESPSPR